MAGRLRRGARRGAALPLGALFLTVAVVVVLAAWERRQETLRLAEIDRERGRIWAMTCTAVHRAVQSGRVTAAQLKGWSLLPAGLGTVGRAGGAVAAASYGAVMVDGVPMAACSLSGPELSFRAPALRAGAVMGGLDRVGAVGGEATTMHGRLGVVRALLSPLPAGSLFATADYGVGHGEDRLHRRPVGGRPELARMETDFVFARMRAPSARRCCRRARSRARSRSSSARTAAMRRWRTTGAVTRFGTPAMSKGSMSAPTGRGALRGRAGHRRRSRAM